MAKYQFTQEDRSKGGKMQPREAKVLAGQKGFERTCELHPYFARKWLKKIIKAQYPKGRV